MCDYFRVQCLSEVTSLASVRRQSIWSVVLKILTGGRNLVFRADVGWRLGHIAQIVLPTATFRLWFVFIILHHERRRIVHFNPTAVVLSFQSAIPRFIMPARISLGLIAVQRGDSAAAAEQYAALETIQGTFLLTLDLGSVDRRLGLFAQTMGALDKASQHFEDGLAFCRKADYRPELAWTCCDYADALLQRNNPGDREKATSLMDESLAISSELGMRPLMERVLSRRNILKA